MLVQMKFKTLPFALFAVVSLVFAAGIACGDDDDDDDSGDTATTTASTGTATEGDSGDSGDSEVCDRRQDVTDSFQSLISVNVIQDGTTAYNEALVVFRDDVDELSEAAGDEYSTEVDAVRTSIDELEGSLESTEGEPIEERAQALAEAAGDVTSSTNALLEAVEAECE
jgi:hypothetical protein